MQLSVTTPTPDLAALFVGPLPTALSVPNVTTGNSALDGFADLLANATDTSTANSDVTPPPLGVVAFSGAIQTPCPFFPLGDAKSTPTVATSATVQSKPLDRPADEVVAAALAVLMPPTAVVIPESAATEVPTDKPASEDETVETEEGSEQPGAKSAPWPGMPLIVNAPMISTMPASRFAAAAPVVAPEMDALRADAPQTRVRRMEAPEPRECTPGMTAEFEAPTAVLASVDVPTSASVPPPTPQPFVASRAESIPADLAIGRILIPNSVARTTPVEFSPGPAFRHVDTPSSLPNSVPVVAGSIAIAAPSAPSFAETLSPIVAPSSFELSLPTPPTNVTPHVDADEKESDTAKIAVEFELDAPNETASENPRPRNFVSSPEKQLTGRRPDLGTSVAKTIDAMPYASNSPRASAHTDFQPVSLVVERVSHAGDSDDVTAPQPPTPEALSTAHRAVEAVLTAAHRYSTGERHAVSLQFSVGGADLNVRVEMRADEVRATFRTDSPELRTALAQEWDAATAANGDCALRLASPVFASQDSSGFPAFSGEQASQQQQRQSAARQANDFFSAPANRGRATAPVAVSVSSSAPRIPLSTALHLHTLA